MKPKRPKRQYTPEQLARLRASMARAREARLTRKVKADKPTELPEGVYTKAENHRIQDGLETRPGTHPVSPLEMTIDQLPQNERIVLARHPDYEGQQTVFVGHHENFVVGMKVPVVRHPSQPGFWTLARELPRFKGRW